MIREIQKFEPEYFKLEKTTVWSFPDRGNWATHDAKWRGNWTPYVPRNILLRYSEEGDYVLDQFVGSGTSLVEAKLLNRNMLGLDVNETALKMCEEKINFQYKYDPKIVVRKGDARNLFFLKDNSIDLICTHPPYADIIKYSDKIENDLSLLEMDDFLHEMYRVAEESYRVLKKNKFCAILMGDIRKKGHVQPLGFSVMNTFIKAGFVVKEIILKEQHNCKKTKFWQKNSVKHNFLLLAHEYLFVFRKP